MRLSVIVVALIVGTVSSDLSAQTATGQQTPLTQRQPCSSSEHRHFDFWIGAWDVSNPAGTVVGSNVIRSLLGGCALQEHWESVRGSVGESYNIYDASRGKWHQTWVDNAGSLLMLEGGLRADTMVLEGETVTRNGGRVRQRVRWYRVGGNADQVRQFWESSTDDGKTWTVAFDGLYRRRK
jgi:hypothetical protein